ncbi:hypothetical protein B5F40_15690 [Gordonibacter sp. An230]|uniref:hypothetical protein n=1 Tax=Gordonibacter sp. An230 TaxID=1965592 RepID=UPI000B3849C3|nr:hypothetical protein [Gordonibacter sp. An230]OUO85675.1 hypothetical protein B5F40_15690 [Gordonibacter sp. An230]
MAEGAEAMPCAPTGLLSSRFRAAGEARTARWYAAYAGEGREDALAAKVGAALPAEVLSEAFCPKWEAVMKRRGTWFKVERPMFRGYVLLASCDGRGLARAVERLSFPVSLAGRRGRALLPVEAEVQRWLEETLGPSRVLRASEGFIEGGKLVVERGPLVGRESRIRKINRHKSLAFVELGQPGAGFLLQAALSVPRKN